MIELHDALPLRYRAALRAIMHDAVSDKVRRRIACSANAFATLCLSIGAGVAITPATATRFRADLEARLSGGAASRAFMVVHKVGIATGDARDWLLENVSDRRAAREILAEPWWPGPMSLAGRLLAEEGQDAMNLLREVDNWLRYKRRVPVVVPGRPVQDLFLREGLTAVNAHARLQRLALGLDHLDPTGPDNATVRAVLQAQCRIAYPSERTRAKATPSAEVQGLLEEVEAARGAPYAEATRETLRATLRRYIEAVREAGVPVRLNRTGLEAYCERVYARFEAGDLAAASAHAYVSQLAPFVAEKDVKAALQALCSHFDVAKRRGVKAKERKLAANPKTLVDFMRTAIDLLDAAPRRPIARARHACYNLAGLVALLVFLPLRRADARTLLVGIHMRRSTVAWSVRDVETQKTGVEVEWIDLPDFLDGALLHGADGQHLWTVYERRRGQALFASSVEGGPYDPSRLSTLFAEHTGLGPHILRTLMTTHLVMANHDRLAIQAMLQHRSLPPRKPTTPPRGPSGSSRRSTPWSGSRRRRSGAGRGEVVPRHDDRSR